MISERIEMHECKLYKMMMMMMMSGLPPEVTGGESDDLTVEMLSVSIIIDF